MTNRRIDLLAAHLNALASMSTVYNMGPQQKSASYNIVRSSIYFIFCQLSYYFWTPICIIYNLNETIYCLEADYQLFASMLIN